MSAATTIETTPKTTDRLALATTGLEPSSAAQLRALFVPFLAQAEEWEARAKAIVVTAVTQKREMKLARESRLALREIRCEVENVRKTAKADALSRGKAIDGIANAIKGVIEPLEAHLQEQEDFAKRYEAAEREKLRAARAEALVAYGGLVEACGDLGTMPEDIWAATLENARVVHEAKLEEARRQEAIRVEAARIEAEQREAARQAAIKAEAERVAREKALAEEAAKLRAEAAERERQAAAERKRVEEERAAERAKAKAEADAREAALRAEHERIQAKVRADAEAARIEREKAEAAQRAEREKAEAEAKRAREEAAKAQAELDAARKAEADRVAAEAESKKPTKAKYATLVAALEKIVEIPPDDRYGVEIVDHEERQELLVRREGRTILSQLDRGEPEDNAFCRDWSWVPDALTEAYALGHADAAAKAREALAAVGLGK